MRTTVTIDDRLYRELKSRAGASGRTIGAIIEDAVRDSLRAAERSARAPMPPLPVFQGKPGLKPGVDLYDNAAVRELMDEGSPFLNVVDVNVLVDAHRPDGPRHQAVRQWLETAHADEDLLGVPGHVASGFVRIVTNRRIFDHPTPITEALAFLEALLASPFVRRMEPGPDHWALFADVCRASGVTGDRVPDAWLAALAIENRATLITADRGFGRYPGLRWRDPLVDA